MNLSDNFQIRPAGVNDVQGITDIYTESVLNSVATYELVPPDLAEMTSRFSSILANGYPYLAGFLDGKLAGYAYASPFRVRPAYRFIVEDSVYLAPHARGIGLGTALLQHLIAQCENLGFRQMIAVIGGPEQASISLHRRCGFVACGTMRGSGYKFGRWLDTLIMQLALGEGNKTMPDEDRYPGTLFNG
jgi:phosphinothricin acetyltransferase